MRDYSSKHTPPTRTSSSTSFGSVIVRAHDRSRFLRSAVESILDQDVSRDRYEIIVVKNYSDNEIDSFLSRASVQTVFCDATSGTQKAAEGFRVSKGDVLFFLDDDDLFEPNRLKIILTEFDENPELGFYRNRVTFIGSNGQRLSPNEVRSFGIHFPRRSPRLYVEGDKKYAGMLRVAKAAPDFNTSSMALRRDLFQQGMPYLSRMRSTL